MRVVVSDTTPLHYLVLVNAIDILPQLYTQVLVPQTVIDELSRPHTPQAIGTWLNHIPTWLRVVDIASSDATLAYLDAGERSAIALAQKEAADLLLMDDRKGVEAARQRGLRVTGTLGVLDRAAERNLIDLHSVLRTLQETTFRYTPELIQALLEEDARRKQAREKGTPRHD